jgi:metal-responsive CopG/Arc/MetJ family transcriptional regulator
MTATAKKKVLVEFPEKLLLETEKTAHDLSTNRSEFIRSAVRDKLKRLERRRLEQELAEGYQANAAFDSELAEEFDHADADL